MVAKRDGRSSRLAPMGSHSPATVSTKSSGDHARPILAKERARSHGSLTRRNISPGTVSTSAVGKGSSRHFRPVSHRLAPPRCASPATVPTQEMVVDARRVRTVPEPLDAAAMDPIIRARPLPSFSRERGWSIGVKNSDRPRSPIPARPSSPVGFRVRPSSPVGVYLSRPGRPGPGRPIGPVSARCASPTGILKEGRLSPKIFRGRGGGAPEGNGDDESVETIGTFEHWSSFSRADDSLSLSTGGTLGGVSTGTGGTTAITGGTATVTGASTRGTRATGQRRVRWNPSVRGGRYSCNGGVLHLTLNLQCLAETVAGVADGAARRLGMRCGSPRNVGDGIGDFNGGTGGSEASWAPCAGAFCRIGKEEDRCTGRGAASHGAGDSWAARRDDRSGGAGAAGVAWPRRPPGVAVNNGLGRGLCVVDRDGGEGLLVADAAYDSRSYRGARAGEDPSPTATVDNDSLVAYRKRSVVSVHSGRSHSQSPDGREEGVAVVREALFEARDAAVEARDAVTEARKAMLGSYEEMRGAIGERRETMEGCREAVARSNKFVIEAREEQSEAQEKYMNSSSPRASAGNIEMGTGEGTGAEEDPFSASMHASQRRPQAKATNNAGTQTANSAADQTSDTPAKPASILRRRSSFTRDKARQAPSAAVPSGPLRMSPFSSAGDHAASSDAPPGPLRTSPLSSAIDHGASSASATSSRGRMFGKRDRRQHRSRASSKKGGTGVALPPGVSRTNVRKVVAVATSASRAPATAQERRKTKKKGFGRFIIGGLRKPLKLVKHGVKSSVMKGSRHVGHPKKVISITASEWAASSHHGI